MRYMEQEKMKTWFIIISLLLVVGLLGGCNRDETGANTRSADIDSAAMPDSEVSGAKIYLYDGSRMTAEIRANKIVQFDSRDSTIAYQLDIDIFDSLGDVSSQVSGDSGIIHENVGQFVIFGNVVVITEDSSRLETDVLYWDSKTDRIHTDAFVRITNSQGEITGWGMESDQRLSWYKILHRVSGEMSNPEKFKGPE